MGVQFHKGMQKTGGRKPGVANIQTRSVRAVIAEACSMLGGSRRLAEWAKESELNEMLYWAKIYPRLLPLTVQGSGLHGEIELNVAVNPDELQAKLIEHGLPTSIYGMDRPVLDAVPAIAPPSNGQEPEGQD
jgi:hypothetical protein